MQFSRFVCGHHCSTLAVKDNVVSFIGIVCFLAMLNHVCLFSGSLAAH